MIPALIPPDEERRLSALRSYGVLDSPFEKDYDDLCRLAATICGAPMALISFIDRDRQWFKSVIGLDTREISRDLAFCAHAIWQDGVFEVPDATLDERFADNPLVTGSPDIRFYAGQPLRSPDGYALGTLCTLDRVPRVLDDRQREALSILARQVVTQLELRRAARELAKLNEDKDRFFSVIAHDMRSPFSGLLGLIDLMHDFGRSMGREEIDKYLGLLHQGLHNYYKFSENLLKWAQLEQGKMAFHPEELSVRLLVDEVLAPLSETLSRKNLTVTLDIPKVLGFQGDRNMAESALRNLVSNAVKFTPEGGKIRLTALGKGGEIRVAVSDTGTGMDQAQLEALREGRRTPSRSGTHGEPGTGLGLVLARQFAARHGGRIEFDSTEGVGTTAVLVLPVQPPELPATQPVAQQS